MRGWPNLCNKKNFFTTCIFKFFIKNIEFFYSNHTQSNLIITDPYVEIFMKTYVK